MYGFVLLFVVLWILGIVFFGFDPIEFGKQVIIITLVVMIGFPIALICVFLYITREEITEKVVGEPVIEEQIVLDIRERDIEVGAKLRW